MQAAAHPRIPPLDPPYPAALDDELRRWMPPGAAMEPLKLFRTLARNPALMQAMRSLGSFILGRRLSLSMRERELLIDRTSACCGANYEWGVHVAAFAAAAGLSEQDVAATAAEGGADALPEGDAILLRLVDELHDTDHITDGLWQELAARWSPEQILEMVVIVGWYHTIAFVINAARVEHEEWAAPCPASPA